MVANVNIFVILLFLSFLFRFCEFSGNVLLELIVLVLHFVVSLHAPFCDRVFTSKFGTSLAMQPTQTQSQISVLRFHYAFRRNGICRFRFRAYYLLFPWLDEC